MTMITLIRFVVGMGWLSDFEAQRLRETVVELASQLREENRSLANVTVPVGNGTLRGHVYAAACEVRRRRNTEVSDGRFDNIEWRFDQQAMHVDCHTGEAREDRVCNRRSAQIMSRNSSPRFHDESRRDLRVQEQLRRRRAARRRYELTAA